MEEVQKAVFSAHAGMIQSLSFFRDRAFHFSASAFQSTPGVSPVLVSSAGACYLLSSMVVFLLFQVGDPQLGVPRFGA